MKLFKLYLSVVLYITTATTQAAEPAHESQQVRSDAMSISPEQTTMDQIAALPDKPFVMLNLLEYTDNEGTEYKKYAHNTVPLVQNLGGRIIYQGTPMDRIGSGNWDTVVLMYYPSPKAFLGMVTSAEYQAGIPYRVAGLKRTVVYAFAAIEANDPLENVAVQGGDEIFVLNLLRFKPDGGRGEYEKYGNVVLPMILERGGAPIVRLKGLLPVVSDEYWEDLYLVHYPNLASLQQMVSSSTWQSANEDRQRGLDLTWAFPTQPDPN